MRGEREMLRRKLKAQETKQSEAHEKFRGEQVLFICSSKYLFQRVIDLYCNFAAFF